MRKFYVLVQKEIRELLTPYMLVPLLITVALFMVLGRVVGKEVAKSNQPTKIVVIDADKTALTQGAISVIKASNFDVKEVNADANAGLTEAKADDRSVLVIFQQGFSEGIYRGTPQNLITYNIVTNFSLTGTKNSLSKDTIYALVNNYVSNDLITKATPDLKPQFLKNPVVLAENIAVGDKSTQGNLTAVLGFISQQTYFIPIILFMVIIFSAQMVATSVASEKENKTLETLLSAPISRQTIVVAKLFAAGLVSLLFSAVYMFALRGYMDSLTGATTSPSSDSVKTAITQLGLNFTPQAYLMMGLTLFVGILCALAIAIILGAFAEDVKSIQTVITPLMILIVIPYLLVMFVNTNTLSPALKYILYAIPFSHPFLAPQYLLLSGYTPVIWGIIYQAGVFVIFVFIASKIFSTDKVLTLRFGKRR